MVTVYPFQTSQGAPCTEEGYMEVDLAAKFDKLAGLDDLDHEAKQKFGSAYRRLVRLSDASAAAMRAGDLEGQLALLDTAYALMPMFNVGGNELEAEWALFQCWLCKRSGVPIRGIQSWNEYFFKGGDDDEE